MCGSMVDSQSATAEIRRGKKKKKNKRQDENIYGRQSSIVDFALGMQFSGATWQVTVNNLPMACICVCPIIWKHDASLKTESTKRIALLEEGRATATRSTCRKLKFSRLVFEIREQSNKQIDRRHTDMLTAILCTPPRDKVTINMICYEDAFVIGIWKTVTVTCLSFWYVIQKPQKQKLCQLPNHQRT